MSLKCVCYCGFAGVFLGCEAQAYSTDSAVQWCKTENHPLSHTPTLEASEVQHCPSGACKTHRVRQIAGKLH